MDDSTFRAYMKDRNFLQSILPISDEFNGILQRIFEVNPYRRIGLEELRELIVRCPRFTTQESSNPTSAPATPPYSPVEKPLDSVVVNGAYETVPHLDLSAQPYHSTTPDFLPHQAMFTPPASGPCTPQPTLYTPQPKSFVPPMYSGPFFGNLPSFGRCGQMFANFNMPTHAWASTF